MPTGSYGALPYQLCLMVSISDSVGAITNVSTTITVNPGAGVTTTTNVNVQSYVNSINSLIAS